MVGKVDGIIQYSDQTIWLMEHKTAADIGGGYIAKLWMDFQIALYAHFLEVTQGIKITGILYNILGKAQIKQKQGENRSWWATMTSK